MPKYVDTSVEVLTRVVDCDCLVKAFDDSESKIITSSLAFELGGVSLHSRLKVAASALNRVYERAMRLLSKQNEPSCLIELHNEVSACRVQPLTKPCAGVRVDARGLQVVRQAALELRRELDLCGFVRCV